MDDTIPRRSAIEAIKSLYPDKPKINFMDNFSNWGKKNKQYIECEQVIGNLPSAQPEPRWISVEEDMPEFGERVLVTKPLVDGQPWVRIAWYGIPMCETNVCFYESDSEWGDYEISGVTAWMPLPEPYREEDGADA